MEILAMLDLQDQQENREQKDLTVLQDLADKLELQASRVLLACWVLLVPLALRELQDWRGRKDNWVMAGSQV